jgi:hypothetical protein
VRGLAFAPGERSLVVADDYGGAIYDLVTHEKVAELRLVAIGMRPFKSAAASPDGRFALFCDDGVTFAGSELADGPLAVSPFERRAATGSADGSFPGAVPGLKGIEAVCMAPADTHTTLPAGSRAPCARPRQSTSLRSLGPRNAATTSRRYR